VNPLAGFLLGGAILLTTAGGPIYAGAVLYAAALGAQATPAILTSRANSLKALNARLQALEARTPGRAADAPPADADAFTVERPLDDVPAPDHRPLVPQEGAPLEQDDDPPIGDTVLPNETEIRIP
jgi:hypothetical protein